MPALSTPPKARKYYHQGFEMLTEMPFSVSAFNKSEITHAARILFHRADLSCCRYVRTFAAKPTVYYDEPR